MTRTLKTGHWVRTADGATGRVRYVHDAQGAADVAIDDSWDDTVTLPLTELRRITDPKQKRPPIDGLPTEGRPACAMCGKPLAPIVETTWHKTPGGASMRWAARKFIRWSDAYGPFHTLSCALRFARAAYRAGYRIQGRS